MCEWSQNVGKDQMKQLYLPLYESFVESSKKSDPTFNEAAIIDNFYYQIIDDWPDYIVGNGSMHLRPYSLSQVCGDVFGASHNMSHLFSLKSDDYSITCDDSHKHCTFVVN